MVGFKKDGWDSGAIPACPLFFAIMFSLAAASSVAGAHLKPSVLSLETVVRELRAGPPLHVCRPLLITGDRPSDLAGLSFKALSLLPGRFAPLRRGRRARKWQMAATLAFGSIPPSRLQAPISSSAWACLRSPLRHATWVNCSTNNCSERRATLTHIAAVTSPSPALTVVLLQLIVTDRADQAGSRLYAFGHVLAYRTGCLEPRRWACHGPGCRGCRPAKRCIRHGCAAAPTKVRRSSSDNVAY